MSSSLTVGSSNSTIAGGAGNDTFKVNVAAHTATKIDGGAGKDLYFDAALSGGSILGGADNDTLNSRRVSTMEPLFPVIVDPTSSCSPARFPLLISRAVLVETAWSSRA